MEARPVSAWPDGPNKADAFSGCGHLPKTPTDDLVTNQITSFGQPFLVFAKACGDQGVPTEPGPPIGKRRPRGKTRMRTGADRIFESSAHYRILIASARRKTSRTQSVIRNAVKLMHARPAHPDFFRDLLGRRSCIAARAGLDQGPPRHRLNQAVAPASRLIMPSKQKKFNALPSAGLEWKARHVLRRSDARLSCTRPRVALWLPTCTPRLPSLVPEPFASLRDRAQLHS